MKSAEIFREFVKSTKSQVMRIKFITTVTNLSKVDTLFCVTCGAHFLLENRSTRAHYIQFISTSEIRIYGGCITDDVGKGVRQMVRLPKTHTQSKIHTQTQTQALE